MISPPTVTGMGFVVPLVDVVGAVTSMRVVLPMPNISALQDWRCMLANLPPYIAPASRMRGS